MMSRGERSTLAVMTEIINNKSLVKIIVDF